MIKLILSREEIDDILSALYYFRRTYPDRKGSVHTRRAMERLEAKFWKILEAHRKQRDVSGN